MLGGGRCWGGGQTEDGKDGVQNQQRNSLIPKILSLVLLGKLLITTVDTLRQLIMKYLNPSISSSGFFAYF